MRPAEFKRTYYPAIERVCARTGLNPLFVAAQAALETGWGERAIGCNLFGITAGDKWTGKRQRVRTTEYFPDDQQAERFPKVYSIVRMRDGRWRYDVERDFRDYDSVEECLEDHFRILSAERYRRAMDYRDDVKRFAYEVAKAGYCTAQPEVYAETIGKVAAMISEL